MQVSDSDCTLNAIGAKWTCKLVATEQNFLSLPVSLVVAVSVMGEFTNAEVALRTSLPPGWWIRCLWTLFCLSWWHHYIWTWMLLCWPAGQQWFGAFIMSNTLNNRHSEETRHVYLASCEEQIMMMLLWQSNSVPAVSLVKFCLGRVWLEARRKFRLVWVKECVLPVGTHHDISFNLQNFLLKPCQPPCPGGSN